MMLEVREVGQLDVPRLAMLLRAWMVNRGHVKSSVDGKEFMEWLSSAIHLALDHMERQPLCIPEPEDATDYHDGPPMGGNHASDET